MIEKQPPFGDLCLHVHTNIRAGTSGIRGPVVDLQTFGVSENGPPSLHPLAEYLNFCFLYPRVLLPSHLPVFYPEWRNMIYCSHVISFSEQGKSHQSGTLLASFKDTIETLCMCTFWVFLYCFSHTSEWTKCASQYIHCEKARSSILV